MRFRFILPMILLPFTWNLARAEQTVKIEFIVTVPTDTPADVAVFLAGNLPAVGPWKADGVKLERLDDSHFAAAVELPKGAKLEYKFTRGSWETVEKGPGGEEITNRTLSIDRPQRVDVRVDKWAAGAGAAGATPAANKSTLTGTIRSLDDFESKILDNRRPIWVYLPPDYDKDAQRRYPVLYMHDGQNCFNDATSFAGEWKADETAERLIKEGRIEPIIIVAIANAGAKRIDEYTPTVDATDNEGGDGDRYARFVMTEVKPFVDKTYRTKPERDYTAICGSSLGGLISLHMARTYPDQIGLCAAVSPSLWWSEKQVLAAIERDPSWTAHCRIWLDMGTAETSAKLGDENIESARKLALILQTAGRQPDRDFRYLEVPNGEHNEPAWATRFDQILIFLFGRK